MASPQVPSSNPIKFGNDFELDTQAYELRRAGRPIKLERIPMELLRLLIEQRGQLVTREQITERIWGRGVFVDSDTCINSAIRKVRHVLRDQPENPRFVQTITGRGYRFIAPLAVGMMPHDAVAPDEESSAPVPVAGIVPRLRKSRRYWLAGLLVASALLLPFVAVTTRRQFLTKPPSDAIRSIAVLPLENLTGDPGQQYFADGMTDALITSLAEIGSLRVISRTSSMRYRDTRKPLRQIAKELGVDAVVEGSVARSANRVRIDAKLIEAAADRHLWAKTYERDTKDILALQADLADAITSQVQNRLTPKQRARLTNGPRKESPIDPQVYEFYLKGRHVMTRGGLQDVRKAIEYFQSGLMKDPNSALLYTGLADAYIHKMSDVYESPTEAVAEARKAVTRALELNELSGEAHTSLASIELFYDWDWKAGENELRRAMELDASYPLPYRLFGGYLTMIGRQAESAPYFEKARKLDPLFQRNYLNEAYALFMARRYDEAIDQCHKGLDIQPDPMIYFILVLALAQKGDYATAISEGEKVTKVDSNPLLLTSLASAYALSPERPVARRLLRRLEEISERQRAAPAWHVGPGRYVCPYEVAGVYAQLREKDRAFEWLNKAYQSRSCLYWLHHDPRLDSLRTDSRFTTLLSAMKFP